MKPSNSEKRRWVINQKILTLKRHKEGTCKTCHKKLSVYNLGKYCFVQQGSKAIPLEIKSGKTINENFFDNLKYWEKLNKPGPSYLIYAGGQSHQRHQCTILPYDKLDSLAHILSTSDHPKNA